MKALLLLLGLLGLVWAQALHVNITAPAQSTQGCGELFVDPTATAQLEDLAHLERFDAWKVGYTPNVFWSRCTLRNESDRAQNLIVRHPRAGIDLLDAYVLRNGEVAQHHRLGDLRPLEDRAIFNAKSLFYLPLAAGEEVELISRFESHGAMELYWQLYDVAHFTRINSYDLLFWGLYGGVIAALVLYNLSVSIGLRERYFFFYVLHALCVLWFMLAQNGILYLLDTGIDLFALTLSTWFVPPLMILFLLLFTMSYFDLRHQTRFGYKALGVLALFNAFGAIVFLYGFIDPSVMALAEAYMVLSFISMFAVIAVALWALLRGHQSALYFLIGEGVYIAALLVVVMHLKGIVAVSVSLSYIPPLAVLFEIIMLSMALVQRVKSMKEAQVQSELLLQQEQRFAWVGRIIANVSHQWRQPFAQLGAHVAALRMQTAGDDRSLALSVREQLPKIEYAIEHMDETLKLFSTFYAAETRMQHFYVEEALGRMLAIFDAKVRRLGVEVRIEGSGIECIGYQSALLNVMGILFENSLDQFERVKTAAPHIRFMLQGGRSIRIEYRDNGGGMGSVSERTGYGMGLEMARTLVTRKLGGTVEIGNEGQGIYCVIVFESLIEV